MSAGTRFRELIDSAKAEVRSWFGHGHATAEEAVAKLDEVQAAVDADAGPLEHEAVQDAEKAGRDALAAAENAGHDAEKAATPLEAEAEQDATALAEDAEHDTAAIAADVHGKPQAAPVPPAAVPDADDAAGSGDASGLEH